ncbi:MAG: DUF4091 domain-containing protein [Armatimonadetes bacterium]|nr:DUF4091 domain-containing protein [Armatimonadota bacterium]MDW8121663.1 DUF4091 domain-containing protein [Armatimonadota bacterium]
MIVVRQFSLSVLFALIAITPAVGGQGLNLLVNGNFEDGLIGWTTQHHWFEFKVNGKGTGLSNWELVSDQARSGRFALKVSGSGNRGIALQALRLPPGRYRVQGWIKTENLSQATASVLVEFLNRDGKWFDAQTAASLSGTQDWTFFEREITFPAGTFFVHFDLLTDRPNNGTAWFDDWRLIGLGGPKGPISVKAGAADSGEIRLDWTVPTEENIHYFQIFLEPAPSRWVSHLAPKTIVDWSQRSVVIPVGTKQQPFFAAVAAVGINSDRLVSPPIKVLPRDTLPPTSPLLSLSAYQGLGDSLYLFARFPLAERDLAAARLLIKDDQNKTRLIQGRSLSGRSHFVAIISRRFLPRNAIHLGVSGVDQSGNEGPIAWEPIPDKPLGQRPLPADCWVTSSLDNVFKDSPIPSNPTPFITMVACRNEEEAVQIVLRPQQKLHQVTVQFSPLKRSDGKGELDPSLFSARFVGYLYVEKNSTATPAEELLRMAPAEFPDPLLEDITLDIEPGVNQPILINVSIPSHTPPGNYSGTIFIVAREGALSVPISVEVFPITLPDQFPFYITNWFNLDRIAQHHSVASWSPEFWKILRLYAREMKRGHQNVVFTPLSLVKVRTVNGQWELDFSDFDRWVQLFEEEGVAERIELTHLGGRTTGEWECPTFSLPPLSLTDVSTGHIITVPIEDFLPRLQSHLQKKGWLKKTLLHIADEPIPVNVASWREQSERAHKAAPLLRRVDAVHVPWSELRGHLEVVVPQLNYLEQWLSDFQQAQKEGAELWFYTAWLPQGRHLNRLIDYPLIKSRLLPWVCYLYNLSGWLHWGWNWWTDFKDMGFAPGDNWIIYPGKYGPRSSLRWEAMRDGFEDLALFLILSQKDDHKVRQQVQKVIRSGTDYTKDPEILLEVRKNLLLSTR